MKKDDNNKSAKIMYVDKINERLGWKRVVLALGVLVFIAITIIIWQLDIDWKEQIRAYGYFGVFLLSLGTSATIVFPLPGEVALFAAPGIMGLSWLGVLFLGIIAGIGAAIGEMTAYYAGRWGRAAVTGRQMAYYEKTARRMKRYGGMAIFVFALTPLPFDVVGLAAGTLRFPVTQFFVLCLAGRTVRATIVVYAGWYGWESIKDIFF